MKLLWPACKSKKVLQNDRLLPNSQKFNFGGRVKNNAFPNCLHFCSVSTLRLPSKLTVVWREQSQETIYMTGVSSPKDRLVTRMECHGIWALFKSLK